MTYHYIWIASYSCVATTLVLHEKCTSVHVHVHMHYSDYITIGYNLCLLVAM